MELKEFEEKINNITEQFMSLIDSNDIIESSVGNKYDTTTKYGTDSTNIGGIAYASGSESYGTTTSHGTSSYGTIPSHAVKFDSAEHIELSQKLEGLYESKKVDASTIIEKPSIAFSDSNLGGGHSHGSYGGYGTHGAYIINETDSTIKNKEVYKMANYCEGEKTGNVLYDFATVPADHALVERKSWKEVLFSDIPWDTKIDIWGGIKKFCTAQVRITFN